MGKKILDEHSKEQIINRILNLTLTGKGSWGNMTVNEMLFHCRKVNNEILQAKQSSYASTFKQKITKIVGLNLLKQFPKGIKTGSKYLPQPSDNIDFYKGQSELIDNIHHLANYKGAIYGKHPFFGTLNTIEWRRFIWMHLDHHLRQFYV